ncbi:MAG: hypothetical protein AAGE94_00155 [Acidobacteriota bacterium]
MPISRSLVAGVSTLLLLLSATCSWAQPPDAEWRTVETEHFRVHYPAETEAWTLRIVSRFESIREHVEAEVGQTSGERVEVLVVDPLARANGNAMPARGWPRMRLYTTPPASDSILGHYADWAELLMVHEDTHLVHLLRPSRNPLWRKVESIVPFGPIARRAPRWVTEGYATVIEGRLTGWGRPHGDLRAALIRRWAQAGQLPGYGELSGNRRWRGMSMAYLVGSAYLEWLEARTDGEALPRVWARMTARADRSFESAFRGVFGDSPRRLYGRFVAETTFRAMQIENEQNGTLVAGTLWQDLDRQPSAPTVSADGEQLAMVLRPRNAPSRLVVWSTAPNDEAAEKRREAIDELLAADPEDVPAVATEVLRRKPVHTRLTTVGAAPFDPRFLPDGSLLFTRFEPDPDGFFRTDLFRWMPATGAEIRVTHGAGVREADPTPDGRHAVAVRYRHGASQLVRVDLSSGAVTEITAPTFDEVRAQPRVSPDGTRVASVVHRGDGWRLAVRHLATGRERLLDTSPRALIVHPAWQDDQTLVASVGERGFVDLVAFDLETGNQKPLTRTGGAAMAPTPDGSGGLYFLALEHDGFDLRHLASDAESPQPHDFTVAGREAELAPAVPPVAPEPTRWTVVEPPAPRPYGTGPKETMLLVGGGVSVAGERIELGLRVGDPVGRLDLVGLLGVDHTDAVQGVVSARWRGLPITLGARLVWAEDRPSEQDGAEHLDIGDTLDATRRGVLVTLGDTGVADGAARGLAWRWSGAAWLGDVEPDGSDRLDQRLVSADGGVRLNRDHGSWRIGAAIDGRATFGETDGHSWRRWGGNARLEGGFEPRGGFGLRLGVMAGRHGSQDLLYDVDHYQLGGLADSIVPFVVRPRLVVPVLRQGSQIGDEHEVQRVDLRLDGGPVVFFERHRLWSDGDDRGAWSELAGVEGRIRSRAMPYLRLPGVDVRWGVATLLDGPFEDDVEGWIGVRWAP